MCVILLLRWDDHKYIREQLQWNGDYGRQMNQSINQSIIYLQSTWISNIKSKWTAWQLNRLLRIYSRLFEVTYIEWVARDRRYNAMNIYCKTTTVVILWWGIHTHSQGDPGYAPVTEVGGISEIGVHSSVQLSVCHMPKPKTRRVLELWLL